MKHSLLRWGSISCLLVCFIAMFLEGTMQHFLLYANMAAICTLVLCWNQYDRNNPRLAELVLSACMIAFAVAGRILFLWAPAFKPVSAIVILAGIWLSSWNGFLCGSLSALLSDLFFGLGPWTFFQMLAWGSIGASSGIVKKYLHKRLPRMIWAALMGVFYSVFMDVYTTLSIGTFDIARYAALLLTSLPFMLIYSVSNVLFLDALYPLFTKKLQRIKQKYDL